MRIIATGVAGAAVVAVLVVLVAVIVPMDRHAAVLGLLAVGAPIVTAVIARDKGERHARQ